MNNEKKIKIYNGMKFAKKIISMRNGAGLSQDKLAAKTGVLQSRIARIELGKEPSINDVIALSNYFHMTIDDLLNNNTSKDHVPKNKTEIRPKISIKTLTPRIN